MKRVRQAAVADVLRVDDVVGVLTGSQFLYLNVLATAVFTSCAEPRTIPELADILSRDFGAPADGDIAAAVDQMLTELIAAGVLEEVV